MTKDPLSAKIDRIIELRGRLQGEEDFTSFHVQELYAEYRRLLKQVVSAIRPVMQRWVDAGLIQVDVQDGEGGSTVYEPKALSADGHLTLICTRADAVQS